MTETELMTFLSKLNYRYKLAIYSDRADFVSEVTEPEKLLELRVFDENGEFRAYRDVLGKPFKCREINKKNENLFAGSFEENQYLDIDTNYKFKDDETKRQATGGGQYHLPEDAKDMTMLKVRYYYNYNSEGIAQKCDWRLAGFEDKEDGPWAKI